MKFYSGDFYSIINILFIFQVKFNAKYQIDVVNQERDKLNLTRVVENPCLNAAAQSHSKYMASKYAVTQDSAEGDLLSLLQAFGMKSFNVATINMGGSYFCDQDFLKALSTEPTNVENMLDPDVRLIGLAVAESTKGIPYWTQIFSNGKCTK
ncbi:hypothetical protein PPL_10099 [Heterostelium album PN500]|uniref:SCP domain-containing protein n=1 Tax=Heterostelium pallidum (strain ATCC 26659 / Pp 5 / PN500) TaxID=670386 RepID=D3BQB4_HETP5|nr:hypothetical protein PPL_10099 [Heterostelium album PN500]EFA76334.1 hypothetical protein PPL_10099 [Heterostelium album PN500]|eukprot:XP_020428466.1 hypothetical protein PPL_10099 [Heterostelium album PN500]